MHPATLFILTLVLPFAGQVYGKAVNHATGGGSGSGTDTTITFPVSLSDELGESSITSLTRSLTRSECHADIAVALKHSCKQGSEGGESGLTELRKRDIAISFTICSMQSALQHVPVECSSWNPANYNVGTDESDQMYPGTDDGSSDVEHLQEKQTSCLGAIHRSPQEWSSYNAFLSDSTQLCHVLEARKQADIAHSRYVNATMEKIAFLDHMKKREMVQLSRERKLESELDERSRDLREASSYVVFAQKKLQDDIELSLELRQDLRNAFHKLESERIGIWDSFERDVKDRLFEADARYEAMLFDLKDGWEAEAWMTHYNGFVLPIL
ncbi:hypothetical protein L486_03053 [Kwoniella mangroviensis CBS 10435]|uniref:Autophagy-related protein 17 n=1 Tax=Kwoniella mangroviensis CBS 10435 TaxID=1331196 RepID=A0A1B9ISR3_9TREE|nr:hypothetical protein L486_03053 [Kwoniella mangroviensis CBS 10435]